MRLYRSKTLNFGAIVMIAGAAQANLSALHGVISPTAYGWATFAIGVGIVALRAVTNEPLSGK